MSGWLRTSFLSLIITNSVLGSEAIRFVDYTIG